jgi:hypothetical protein
VNMSSMPTYNFAITLDDNAVEQQLSQNDRLSVGDHELEILDVKLRDPKDGANEPTWLRFQLVLGRPGAKAGPDGKFKGAIYHTALVPTQDITYNGKVNVFGMLQSFFSALGQRLVPSNTPELVMQYFSDYTKLKGMKVKATIGYSGNYIAKIDGSWSVVDRGGKPVALDGNSFDSYDAAFGAAAIADIKVERFMGVLRFQPGELQEPVKAEAPKKGKKPTASFGE